MSIQESRIPFPSSGNPPAEQNVASGHASTLVDRVARSAHETIDHLAERAVPQARRLEAGVAEANTLLQQRAAQAQELSAEWVDTLRATVREHPLATLAAGVALGMLVSRLR